MSHERDDSDRTLVWIAVLALLVVLAVAALTPSRALTPSADEASPPPTLRIASDGTVQMDGTLPPVSQSE